MYQWFELANLDSAQFKELARLLRERRIPVDLTLRASELIYFYDDVDTVLPIADRQFMHPGLLKSWFQSMTASHYDWTKDDYRRARAVMPKVLQLAHRFFDSGIPLFLGTDGTGGGPDYVRELALHVQAGISVWDVLQLATNLAAQRLGVAETTGTIEIGKEADIVFLKANPLDGIENIRKVDTVISNGIARRAADMIEQSASLARD
jgi:imidazolonepropionase-like amidohydrolase